MISPGTKTAGEGFLPNPKAKLKDQFHEVGGVAPAEVGVVEVHFRVAGIPSDSSHGVFRVKSDGETPGEVGF